MPKQQITAIKTLADKILLDYQDRLITPAILAEEMAIRHRRVMTRFQAVSVLRSHAYPVVNPSRGIHRVKEPVQPNKPEREPSNEQPDTRPDHEPLTVA
jgi:hypothetical protein